MDRGDEGTRGLGNKFPSLLVYLDTWSSVGHTESKAESGSFTPLTPRGKYRAGPQAATFRMTLYCSGRKLISLHQELVDCFVACWKLDAVGCCAGG